MYRWWRKTLFFFLPQPFCKHLAAKIKIIKLMEQPLPLIEVPCLSLFESASSYLCILYGNIAKNTILKLQKYINFSGGIAPNL